MTFDFVCIYIDKIHRIVHFGNIIRIKFNNLNENNLIIDAVLLAKNNGRVQSLKETQRGGGN